MGIHWSLPLLESLLPEDLTARLKEAYNDPFVETPLQDEIPIYNGLTGKIMKALPIPRTIRVSRRKMRAFCSQGIDVQYGKELCDISYGPNGVGVTARFKNGDKLSGTVIIGCDGPRSSVRDYLFGPEKASVTPLNVVHSNVAVQYNDAVKAKFVRSTHPLFSLVTHPDCFCFISIQDVPDPQKPETWRFQIVTSWLGQRDTSLDNAGRLAQVKAKAEVLPEPFRSANLWMPEDTHITYDSIGYWVSVPWDNRQGRTTLAGDAAHPMSPHRGQGLNHAICDASKFVAAMGKVHTSEIKLQEAITSYDEEVVRRGADEVEASKQSAYMMLDWNRVMDSPIMTRSLEKADLGS
ncbi:hypothetical protein MMC24_003364 [Lignoscripta atroalba]|nr:hypothetical protein [Lignoscripta atroalba]